LQASALAFAMRQQAEAARKKREVLVVRELRESRMLRVRWLS
jgi:hypothetical protein